MTQEAIHLQDIFANRRTIYALTDQLPVSEQAVVDAVEHAILHTPSAFNSQTTRITVLFGEAHKRLWDIAEANLRQIVGDNDFSSTKQKMDGFRAGAGTILYFEDNDGIKALQEQFAIYADSFPVYAEHTNAMHQYAVWTQLSNLGIGASLQHYSAIFEQDVAQAFNIPSNWKLIAQMPFGGIAAQAGEKEFAATEARVMVVGQQ